MKKYKSHILAVTTDAAKRVCQGKQGFIPVSDIKFEVEDIWVGPRTLLEQDSNFKHIIPYIVIKHKDTFLVYQRTSTGGEGRLHGNHSIGFGGHIDVGDVEYANNGETIDVFKSILYSAERELYEELYLDYYTSKNDIIGFLYDDTNSVGEVHLGVVMVLDIEHSEGIHSPENQIDLKGFLSLSEIQSIDNFENWSSILIERFKEGI